MCVNVNAMIALYYSLRVDLLIRGFRVYISKPHNICIIGRGGGSIETVTQGNLLIRLCLKDDYYLVHS